MLKPARIMPCPTCRKPVRWSESNQYRPFCSERCRLIDFGGWADESHKIAGDESFDDVLSKEVDRDIN